MTLFYDRMRSLARQWCGISQEQSKGQNPRNSYPHSKLWGITEFRPFGYGFCWSLNTGWRPSGPTGLALPPLSKL